MPFIFTLLVCSLFCSMYHVMVRRISLQLNNWVWELSWRFGFLLMLICDGWVLRVYFTQNRVCFLETEGQTWVSSFQISIPWINSEGTKHLDLFVDSALTCQTYSLNSKKTLLLLRPMYIPEIKRKFGLRFKIFHQHLINYKYVRVMIKCYNIETCAFNNRPPLKQKNSHFTFPA